MVDLDESKFKFLCSSFTRKNKCLYNDNCNFAHSLKEQVIDLERLKLINLIDKIDFDLTKQDYNNLIQLCYVCVDCEKNECSGGYNCKYGIYQSLKICRNDLINGDCMNELIDITIPQFIITKFGFSKSVYKGCCEGHHLSVNGLIPYYKNQKIIYDKEFCNNLNKSSSSDSLNIDDEINEILESFNINIDDY